MKVLTKSIAVLAILFAGNITHAQQPVEIPAEAVGVLQYGSVSDLWERMLSS
jgi:hypothetical protein